MERIDISEGEEGYIYRDGDMAYKLFKTRNLKILNGKAESLKMMDFHIIIWSI